MKATAGLSLLLLAMAGGALAHQPPADLHWTGDHWTAWQPPSPPAEAQVHVIQQGDTLWDLAGQFYGDPYLWPQLWEQNQYILDAHWIYPGDPLVVAGTGASFTDRTGVAGAPIDQAGTGTGGEAGDPFTAPTEERDTSRVGDSVLSGSDGPVPLGFESDIYCSGYISDTEDAFPYRVAGSEYEFLTPTLDPGVIDIVSGDYGKASVRKIGLSTGDIAYIEGGRADGLSAGELLTAVLPEQTIEHPLTGEPVGRFYNRAGRLRILSVQESSSIAEVVMTCDPIPVGTMLKIFEPEPVPLRRVTAMRPVNYPASEEQVTSEGASIVYAESRLATLGSGHLVFIDRGTEQDIAPGDIYTIYRRGRRGYPPIVLGEVGVLSVQRSTALGRILNSRYTVYIGDALLPK